MSYLVQFSVTDEFLHESEIRESCRLRFAGSRSLHTNIQLTSSGFLSIQVSTASIDDMSMRETC